MNRKEIQDILSAHADQLIDRVAPAPRRSPRHDQVQGLLDLAEQLQGILIPMAPDANFRRRLHGDLILEAQRRGPEPEASLFEQHRKGILIGRSHRVGGLGGWGGHRLCLALAAWKGNPHRHRLSRENQASAFQPAEGFILV